MCKSRQPETDLFVCDECNNGYHTDRLQPPFPPFQMVIGYVHDLTAMI